MHNSNTNLVADVLQCLEQVTKEQLVPEQALDRMHSLRELHRDATIDLVWDDEAFDGSFHYDALVRPANAAKTFSLSVCPDDELPWVLRGLQRWRDSELLRVNDVTMAVEQAIAQLDVVWGKPGLMQKLIDSCLITSELQRRNIQASKAEVQSAFDSLRRRRGLYTAAQLREWLESSGQSMAMLEELATRYARTTKLRDAVIGLDAGAYFETHGAQFDEIKLALVEVTSEDIARTVAQSARSVGLLEAAQQAFVADRSGETRVSFKHDARYALAAEFELNTWTGGAVYVSASDDRYLVMQVIAIHEAEASPLTTQRVKNKLFQDWLAEQRRAARIEWFWGDAQRTGKGRAAN